MYSSVYAASVRDKLILAILIVFGICAFVTLWMGKATEAVIVGIIGNIITGLFGVYQGNPSKAKPPEITEQITTQTTETKTEAGTGEKGGES